jgi:hypothetical protein
LRVRRALDTFLHSYPSIDLNYVTKGCGRTGTDIASKVLTSEASTEGKLVSPGPINRPVIYVRSFCYLVNRHGTPAQEHSPGHSTGYADGAKKKEKKKKKSGDKDR